MPERAKYFSPVANKYKKRDNLRMRDREVRDLYNTLRRHYVGARVYEFFALNYFMSQGAVDLSLRRCDNRPVDIANASIQYRAAMAPDFKL